MLLRRGEVRNANRILVRKLLSKWLLGRPTRRLIIF
jgi:hypothetical protein